MTIATRFWVKVEKTDTCWLWRGSKNNHGYGRIAVKGASWTMTYAHRWAYEDRYGLISDGMEIDHLCRNPDCVNPEHLEVVTHRENMLRGNTVGAYEAAQTHCAHGHPFSSENTYLRKDRLGRMCKECGRQRKRQRRRERSRLKGGVSCGLALL